MKDVQDTGQDSFLDIVANLVGILIILVVVVGAQASRAWSQPKMDESISTELKMVQEEINKNESQHQKWAADRQALQESTQREMDEVRRLAARRHEMLLELELVQRQTAKEKELLTQKEKKQVEEQVKLAAFQLKKRKLQENLAAVKNSRPKSRQKTIDHFPTPIAKTVFSDEIHFRLENDRLVYVPLEELIAKMKSEWKFKAEKLERVQSTTETVSEISGFRMQYQLVATSERVSVPGGGRLGESRGTATSFQRRTAIQVAGFRLIPTRPEMGETLEMALKSDSDFIRRIQKLEPGRTTVSIWVYPESFQSYRKLKDWLQEKGFQSAAWPIATGKLISGGPNGLRSTAQ